MSERKHHLFNMWGASTHIAMCGRKLSNPWTVDDEGMHDKVCAACAVSAVRAGNDPRKFSPIEDRGPAGVEVSAPNKISCPHCGGVGPGQCACVGLLVSRPNDVDRIAHLESELDAKHSKLVEVADKLRAERAAHERTKADLAAVRRYLDENPRSLGAQLECTKAELAAVNEAAQALAKSEAEYRHALSAAQARADKAEAELKAAATSITDLQHEMMEMQAEAAEMRAALTHARGEISRMATTGTGFSCAVMDEIDAALVGTAGRALAARVRAVAEAVTVARGVVGCADNSCMFAKSKGMATNGGCRCLGREGGHRPLVPQALSKLFQTAMALVDLDEKGGGS